MNAQSETISLCEFLQRFPNEESSRVYFEEKRWHNGRSCPHCGSTDTSECSNHIPMPYRCKDCRKHFSVRTNSTLEKSRLSLHKWLMAIYMMTIARKGIPSTQMARELGITQKSAWFLSQRIRESWNLHSSDIDPSIVLQNIKVVTNSNKLSMGAKAFYVYLINKIKESDILLFEDILKDFKDGEKKIRSSRKELLDNGLLVMQQIRNSNGKFNSARYILTKNMEK